VTLKRSLLNTSGLLLLALAVFYSARYWPQRVQLQENPAAESGTADHPDYVITDFHAIDLDESGRIRYELTASELTHFRAPERANLVAPDMIFYRNNHADGGTAARPWQLTSTRGVIAEDGQRLDLAGEVKLARLVEDPQSAMTLETEMLTVLGQREMAITDQPFVLRTAQGQLTGVGLDADLKNSRMNLHARVRGQYDPP
jgi:lipopolysaccharide export system protein LptC